MGLVQYFSVYSSNSGKHYTNEHSLLLRCKRYCSLVQYEIVATELSIACSESLVFSTKIINTLL